MLLPCSRPFGSSPADIDSCPSFLFQSSTRDEAATVLADAVETQQHSTTRTHSTHEAIPTGSRAAPYSNVSQPSPQQVQPLDPPPEDNPIIDDDDDWAGSPLVATATATATAEERVADSTLPIEKEKGQDAKNALGSLQQQPQKPSPAASNLPLSVNVSSGSGAIDAFYAKYGKDLVDEFVSLPRQTLANKQKHNFLDIQERLNGEMEVSTTTMHEMEAETRQADGTIISQAKANHVRNKIEELKEKLVQNDKNYEFVQVLLFEQVRTA